MYEIGDNDVVVESVGDLELVVGPGYNYDTIYLGADIQLTNNGITIDPNKTSIIIDGFFDNVTHSFTDSATNTESSAMGIWAQSSISITLKNMVIHGHNFYGVPFITENYNTDDVSVIYDNVTYTGPQLTHNPRGFTRYKDCDITISYPSSTARESEVGEVSRVEFDGETTIFHNISSTAAFSTFWFRAENLGTSYFKVLRGAKVNIRTTNYFMFCLVSLLPNPVAFILEPDSIFELTTHHGFVQETSHRVSSFLVDTGASYKYVQETSNLLYHAMYLNGALTINEGASVYMEASFSGSTSLIDFMQSGEITITNPKSFVLYSRAGRALTFNAARTFEINTRQLNLWSDVPSAQNPGDMDDIPQSRWYKPDNNWTPFAITGSVATFPAVSTTVSTHTFTTDELTQISDLIEFQLQNAMALSAGNLTIVDNPIMDDESSVTGWTEPGASIRLEYDTTTINSTAGEKGRYLIDTLGAVSAGTNVTIKSNTPFLTTTNVNRAITAGDLEILSAPVEIVFARHPVQESGLIILPRTNPEEPVIISDTRDTGTQWQLWASVQNPLETQSGDIWEGEVIFVEGNLPDKAALGVEPILVYTGTFVSGNTDVFWDAEHGILVELTGSVRYSVRYTSHVTWDLRIIID